MTAEAVHPNETAPPAPTQVAQPTEPTGPQTDAQLRAAATDAAKKMLASALAEEEAPAEQPAAPPAEAAPEAAVAEAEPAAPPEPPKTEKHSIIEQSRRYRKQAEAKLAEAQRMLDEAKREREEARAEREAVKAFRGKLREKPFDAVAEELGMRPEQLVASFADSKANALPAEVAARIKELEDWKRTREEGEAKAKEEYQKRAEAQASQRSLQEQVSHLANVVNAPEAEEFPHYSALEERDRLDEATRALSIVYRDNIDCTLHEVLQVIEEREKRKHNAQRKSERLAKLYDKPAATKNGNGAAPATGKAPPRAPSARDAAEPPQRRELTDSELRAAAIAKVRELTGG